MKNQMKGAVLDMDGLLVDTEYRTYRLCKAAAAEMGVTLSLDLFKQTVGLRSSDTKKIYEAALGAAFCYAIYQLLTRKLSEVDSPSASNFFTGVVNTLVMSALVPFFWHTPTWEHAALAVVLGAFGMIAHLFLTQAFRHAAPAMLAPFSYCQVVFAGVLGFVLFGHSPDKAGLVGIALICLSGLCAAWLQRKP